MRQQYLPAANLQNCVNPKTQFSVTTAKNGMAKQAGENFLACLSVYLRPLCCREALFHAGVVDAQELRSPSNHVDIVLLLTGMRSQELLALEAGNIEPDGSCIHIRQAVKQVKGTVFVGATKSATSVRDMPIPEAYRDMVKCLRTYCTPYLWTGKGGDKPSNPTHFRDKFAAAIESIPGVRPLTPHSCRHTFVSQLQAQGVPMETIQSLAGHAEMDMTEHYLHVQSGVKTAAVESLAQLIGA